MSQTERRGAVESEAGPGAPTGRSRAAELLATGLAHHQAGRVADAEKSYLAALALEPEHAEALHLLGVLALQVGRADVASALIERAARKDGTKPAYFANLALALQQQGRLDDALRSLDAALACSPDHVEALNNRGNVLLRLGRFGEALASYDRLVALRPDLSQAFHNRAIALKELGRPADALASYDRALALQPDYVEALNGRGNILLRLDRLEAALESYDRALALRPDYVDALQNRGEVLLRLGRHEAAAEAFERALVLRPELAGVRSTCANLLIALGQGERALRILDAAPVGGAESAEAWLARGTACAGLARQDDALAAFGRACELAPQLAQAWLGSANVLAGLERHEEAVAAFIKALTIDPTLAAAWLGLGNVLSSCKHHQEALDAYDRALQHDPGLAGAWVGRGNVLSDLIRTEEALAAYGEALRREPGLAHAHLGVGHVLARLRRPAEALAAFDRALALRGDLAEAWLGRGNALRELTRYPEAIAAFGAALRFKPQLHGAASARLAVKLKICDWENFAAERADLSAALARGRLIPPHEFVALATRAEDQYRVSKLFSDANWPDAADRRQTAPRPRRDRIRLAYISADFRGHPMAYLMADVFEQHDASRFEVTAISLGQDDGSVMRKRLQSSFARFVEAGGLSDDRLVALIADSDIDILVDLMGFTKGARTAVLARRPAPVQVNFLGFPGTMGARFIDYIIADRVVIPDPLRAFISEKIAYMPFSYYPNGREPYEDRTMTREEAGLPPDAFVFCCFNNGYKILPDMFDVWMRILRQVDGSVLWLRIDEEEAVANLRREAAARGVAAQRLLFAPRAPRAEHQARQRCADLFLDTVPCNAHTTAIDCLQEGLPVLTCPGEAFASRVAASLLTALGLPELIAASMQDYESIAIALARAPDRLEAVRRKLLAYRQTAALFDTRLYTRQLEAAYAMMYERDVAGLAPEDFTVPASGD